MKTPKTEKKPAKPQADEPRPAAVARVPWNPWWGAAFVVVVFFGSQFFSSLLISLYIFVNPWLRHWSQAQINDWLDRSVVAQFVFILIAETVAVGAIYLFLKRRSLKLSFIGLKRPRWLDAAYGLTSVVPYYVIYLLTVGVVSSLVSGLNVNQQQQIGFNSVHGPGQLVMTFVALVVLPPLAEEIMVRGFLYSSLKSALPTFWAVVLTSGMFAAAHLPEGGAAGPLYIGALDTFVLSLVLIFLREKTGSLWAPITLHAIKNGVAFTALFALHVK